MLRTLRMAGGPAQAAVRRNGSQHIHRAEHQRREAATNGRGGARRRPAGKLLLAPTAMCATPQSDRRNRRRRPIVFAHHGERDERRGRESRDSRDVAARHGETAHRWGPDSPRRPGATTR